METEEKRLLIIDDDFHPDPPDGQTGAEQQLRCFIDEFKSSGYKIGPSDFSGFTPLPDAQAGVSVCNPLLNNKFPFIYPNKNQCRCIHPYPGERQCQCSYPDTEQCSRYGSMFFTADAAFRYFKEFVTQPARWDEIAAVVIDIMMPPGDLLPAKREYRRKVNETNAGDYLKEYLKELVATYRIPQNPNTILPVMVLTNKRLTDDGRTPLKVNQNGRQSIPRQGDTDRLWVWNMEKAYALDNPGALVSNLNQIVAGRVR